MSSQLDRMQKDLEELLYVTAENRILEKWILAGVIVCITLLVRHSPHDVTLFTFRRWMTSLTWGASPMNPPKRRVDVNRVLR